MLKKGEGWPCWAQARSQSHDRCSSATRWPDPGKRIINGQMTGEEQRKAFQSTGVQTQRLKGSRWPFPIGNIKGGSEGI